MLNLSQRIHAIRSRGKGDSSGITMVEVILSVAIIGVLVSSFVVFITKIAQEQRYADNRAAALNVMKRNTNQMLVTPWNNLVNSYAGGRLTSCDNTAVFTGTPPATSINGQQIGYVGSGTSDTWATWTWNAGTSSYTVNRASTSIQRVTGVLLHTMPPVYGTDVVWTGKIVNTSGQAITIGQGGSWLSIPPLETVTVPVGATQTFTLTTKTNFGGGTFLQFAVPATTPGNFTVSDLQASTTMETSPAGLVKYWMGTGADVGYVASGTPPTWTWLPNSSSYTVTRAAGSSLSTGFRLTGLPAKAGQPVWWTVTVDNPARVSTNDPTPAPPASTDNRALTVEPGNGYSVPNQPVQIILADTQRTVSVLTQTDATGTTVLNFTYPTGTGPGASFSVRGAVAALPETVAQSGGQILNSTTTGKNIAAATDVSWADGTSVTCANRGSQTSLKKVVLTTQWYDGSTLKNMATATYRSQYASGG